MPAAQLGGEGAGVAPAQQEQRLRLLGEQPGEPQRERESVLARAYGVGAGTVEHGLARPGEQPLALRRRERAGQAAVQEYREPVGARGAGVGEAFPGGLGHVVRAQAHAVRAGPAAPHVGEGRTGGERDGADPAVTQVLPRPREPSRLGGERGHGPLTQPSDQGVP
ncbi:hypothetical protein, partial [Streptomyces sp. SPB78]|uniref:hypothetical protein n=1 Tax=Streptomyces sp. (strain SPB78) TaxID=591157 RepID=UPI003B63BCF0